MSKILKTTYPETEFRPGYNKVGGVTPLPHLNGSVLWGVFSRPSGHHSVDTATLRHLREMAEGLSGAAKTEFEQHIAEWDGELQSRED